MASPVYNNYTIYITELKINNADYVIGLWNVDNVEYVCRIVLTSEYIDRQYFFASYIYQNAEFFDISPLDMFILINNKILDNSLYFLQKSLKRYNLDSWTEILECLKNQ